MPAIRLYTRFRVEENSLRLALEPHFDFPGGQQEMEKVMEAKGDLAFTVAFETLPKVEIGSFEEDPLTCYPPTDRDLDHFWLVGVHVP